MESFPERIAPMPRRFLAGFALFVFSALAPALDRDSAVARLKSDVTFLASAECEGRGPGTAGIDKAADYVAAAFKKSGLKGGMPDGSYFQPFTFKGSPTLGEDVSVELVGPDGGKTLKLAEEYQPHGLSGKGKAAGGIA